MANAAGPVCRCLLSSFSGPAAQPMFSQLSVLWSCVAGCAPWLLFRLFFSIVFLHLVYFIVFYDLSCDVELFWPFIRFYLFIFVFLASPPPDFPPCSLYPLDKIEMTDGVLGWRPTLRCCAGRVSLRLALHLRELRH